MVFHYGAFQTAMLEEIRHAHVRVVMVLSYATDGAAIVLGAQACMQQRTCTRTPRARHVRA